MLLKFDFLLLFADLKLLVSLIGFFDHVHYVSFFGFVENFMHGRVTEIPQQ